MSTQQKRREMVSGKFYRGFVRRLPSSGHAGLIEFRSNGSSGMRREVLFWSDQACRVVAGVSHPELERTSVSRVNQGTHVTFFLQEASGGGTSGMAYDWAPLSEYNKALAEIEARDSKPKTGIRLAYKPKPAPPLPGRAHLARPTVGRVELIAA